MTTSTIAVSTVERPGTCAHPSIPDERIVKAVEDAFRFWDANLSVIPCPDCGETLYPSGDEPIVVYVGEPHGADVE